MTRGRLVALLALLVLAVTGCTAAAGGSGGGSGSGGAGAGASGGAGATLDATGFAERTAGDGVVVLDVRTPEEYAEGHLPGAVNVDVSAPDFEARVAALGKGATYAVYCRSGNRSAVAMQQMVDAGFSDVAHLAGGIGAWQQAGGEVVTD